jgi:TolB-like protein/DNA-binding winged helix-turn-helix (wHTH) protein
MDLFAQEHGSFRWGCFTLDPRRRSLSCDGKMVKLAERLFDVLLYLVSNHGRVVERDELLREVWAGRIVEDNNVSQAIFELRKVLKAGGNADRSIITVPGRGFRFAEPVTFELAPPSETDLSDTARPDTVADQAVSPGLSWWRGHVSLGIALFSLVIAVLSLAIWVSHTHTPAGGQMVEKSFDPPAHSVAVLAFDNMSGDPAQTYVSDGMSEQLIDQLTQIDAIQVAARVSAFSFRGGHATIGQIAHALNVGAVLAGSVRRSGNRVVVTAQLTDARTGFNIWSRTYDRDVSDIVKLPTDIALAVARSMQVVLAGDARAEMSLGGTANVAAYDAYLRGLNLRRAAHGVADYQEALAAFDRALALDPGFALGHAKRAVTLVALFSLGTFNTAAQQQLVRNAQDAADRAVALAPMLGAAHSARGAVLGHCLLDAAGAFSEQAKAKELTPGNAGIESNYASAALALGHAELAVEAARRATALDPLDPNFWGQLAQVLYESHRYQEALNALDRERAVAGSLPLRHDVLRALILLMMGHAEAARAICAAGRDWQEIQLLALADHALGHQAAADADLAMLRAALGDDAASNYAEIYAQWGRKAEALRWFDKAVQDRNPGLLHVALDPLLDPIRGEAPFKAALAKLSGADRH